MNDNAGLQWTWFNMIHEVILGTTKVGGVPSNMNNDLIVGVEDQPPNQPVEWTQHVPKESPKTRAFNLYGITGQLVKRRKLASDMLVFLDRLHGWICRIEDLKLEAAIKLHEDNRISKLEMFKLT